VFRVLVFFVLGERSDQSARNNRNAFAITITDAPVSATTAIHSVPRRVSRR